MRVRLFFLSLGCALILASLVSPLPVNARGTGAASKVGKVGTPNKPEKKDPPAPQPRRDETNKVYTNDDFGWFSPSASNASQSEQAVAAAPPESGAEPVLAAKADFPGIGLDQPQQDPQWYARQVTSLENELAAVQSKEDALQQFQDTSSGLPTGLNLSAPTEAITTDGLIAQLELRSQQIAQQLDDLTDLARVSGLPPGTVNQPSVTAPPPPTLAQQQDALVAEYQDVSDQLAQNQATLDAMQQQAAAQNITLLPVTPGDGGNQMTNLLENLDSQASALQNALIDAEDNARTLGVAPGDLR